MIASRGPAPDALNMSLTSDVATVGLGDDVVAAEAQLAKLNRNAKTPMQNPVTLER
jgi:hypothetical protein